jgi:hypothetical protein
MRQSLPTGLIVNPIPRTSDYFKARDYKPKYHVFYDPTQAVQRIIDAPIGMEHAEIEVPDEQ